VVQFDVGTDGKLYPENTYNVVQGSGYTGTYPTAAAVDAAGKFLYVVFTYQNGYTTVRPGPGGIATFPINSDGSLGTALTNTTIGTTSATPLPYIPLGFNPVAVAASPTTGNIYVLDQDGPPGTLLSFTENASTGALTTLATTSLPGTTAVPTALAETPTGGFLFVTDSSANMVYTYRLAGGLPASLPASQATTGLTPAAVTIEPRGLFAYVANYGASTVGTYAINASTGALTSTGATESVGTGPSCVAIDPALGIYLYTSNNLSSSVSGEQLNPKTGALENIQGTPFNSQPLPTCLVAVANGAHATQLLQ